MGQRESLFTDEGRWRRPLGTSAGHYLRTIDRRVGFGNTHAHTHTHTQVYTYTQTPCLTTIKTALGAKGKGMTAAVKMEIRSRPRGLSFCRTRRNGILIVAYRNSVCMCIMTYSRRCSTSSPCPSFSSRE